MKLVLKFLNVFGSLSLKRQLNFHKITTDIKSSREQCLDVDLKNSVSLFSPRLALDFVSINSGESGQYRLFE